MIHIKPSLKEAYSDPVGIFCKLLKFWYHKNSHIFLIIILKFHAFIPCRSEEYIKNVPIDYVGNHRIKL